jgi:hypothetical protein
MCEFHVNRISSFDYTLNWVDFFFLNPAVFVIVLLEVHHQSTHQGMLEGLG